jgi:ankyrin repeat protein
MTPLMITAANGFVEAAQLLLKHKSDPNTQTNVSPFFVHHGQTEFDMHAIMCQCIQRTYV